VLVHAVRRLGGEVLVVAEVGEGAEAALGERRELVVVVEDHPPVAADAEVLEQQVAGEDVGHGEVADGLPVVDDGGGRTLGRGRARVDVERDELALGVRVGDHHAVAIGAHGGGRDGHELVEQRRREVAPAEDEPLELLRVGEAGPRGRARTRTGSAP
jgi:hypothetical protein